MEESAWPASTDSKLKGFSYSPSASIQITQAYGHVTRFSLSLSFQALCSLTSHTTTTTTSLLLLLYSAAAASLCKQRQQSRAEKMKSSTSRQSGTVSAFHVRSPRLFKRSNITIAYSHPTLCPFVRVASKRRGGEAQRKNKQPERGELNMRLKKNYAQEGYTQTDTKILICRLCSIVAMCSMAVTNTLEAIGPSVVDSRPPQINRKEEKTQA